MYLEGDLDVRTIFKVYKTICKWVCGKINEKREKKKSIAIETVETPDLFGLYEFLKTYLTAKQRQTVPVLG